MMGEELNACEVTDRGLLGDRRLAVVDRVTGKVGGAKNPRKWHLLRLPGRLCRAPQDGSEDFPGPDDTSRWDRSDREQPDLEQILSRAFGRDLQFQEAGPASRHG